MDHDYATYSEPKQLGSLGDCSDKQILMTKQFSLEEQIIPLAYLERCGVFLRKMAGIPYLQTGRWATSLMSGGCHVTTTGFFG